MLYHVFYPLKIFLSSFNIFSYITFRALCAMATALFLSFVIGPSIISYLKKLQYVQIIRSDGPQTHLAKSGTPTMGGILILISVIVSTLLWARLDNRFILWIIFGVLWLGMLGFIDDYLKIARKNPKGLNKTWKLIGQSLFALGVCLYLFYFPSNQEFSTKINIPYLKEVYINLGWCYVIFAMLVIVASSNAVNLTDGLDGLAIGSLVLAAFTYSIFAYVCGHAKFSNYLKVIPVAGAGELTVFLAAVIGAGLGFLWFNGFPAEVFMGDTGALFLGGAIGLVSVFIKQELILIVVGGVFVIEVVSVVLQVYSYRRYKKRIFRMAPLHHHFELKGWAEPKVTLRFWIIGIILTLLAITSLKIR